MVDKDFIKIKDQVDYLVGLIDSSMNNYERDGFENQKIYRRLEDFQGSLESLSEFIKYMNKKPIVGHLQQIEGGKYECPEADVHFSCGSRMEAFVQTEYDDEPTWCSGRVEHQTDGGYYFLNYDGDNVFLYEGMKVRVR